MTVFSLYHISGHELDDLPVTRTHSIFFHFFIFVCCSVLLEGPSNPNAIPQTAPPQCLSCYCLGPRRALAEAVGGVCWAREGYEFASALFPKRRVALTVSLTSL